MYVDDITIIGTLMCMDDFVDLNIVRTLLYMDD